MLVFLVALLGRLPRRAAKLTNDLFPLTFSWHSALGFQLLVKTLTEVTQNAFGGKLTFGLAVRATHSLRWNDPTNIHPECSLRSARDPLLA